MINSQLPPPPSQVNEPEEHAGSSSGAYGGQSSRPGKLAVPTDDGVLYVAFGDILLLIAEGSYTRVHCQDGSEYLMCGNLQKVVNRLPSGRFHRCHRRYVINLGKITKLIRNGGYRAVLNTGMEVEVSRRHWAALLLAMGGA